MNTATLMTMDDSSSLLRTEYLSFPLRDLMRQSPRVFLGVTTGAVTLLRALDVETVFDLASSSVFNDALRVVQAAHDARSASFQHGATPSDLVDAAQTFGRDIGDLQYLSLAALKRMPSALVGQVEAELDLASIRDLAYYPPYRAARELMNLAYFPDNQIGFDAERPADLLPKSGDFPTERVQYTTLLLDEIPLDDGVALQGVSAPNFQPIDLALLAQGDAGFKKTAYGALLTFNQSWYAQGVTLGQLLHSTALAPGESTRIAVIDWSRKSRSGQTEVIDESDDLSNELSHNRSITEVTQAVANEAQGGFSQAHTNSQSSQTGVAAAAELSAPLGGLLGGPSASMGFSTSQAQSSTSADSYSSSWGHRDIGSSMAQKVNDRTHQHAHSNRSRRASVVKEVSQSEHEAVSTRVIANYNHMHALTVQYYEVVQLYRVEVSIAQVDRVVFIPFQLVDFNNDQMVRRFQSVLARVALGDEIRQSLQMLETLALVPDQSSQFAALGDSLPGFLQTALSTRTSLSALSATLAASPQASAAPMATSASLTASRVVAPASTQLSKASALSLMQDINAQLWQVDQTARLAGLLNWGVLRPNSSSLFLPSDVWLEGASVDAQGAAVKLLIHDLGNRVIDTQGVDWAVALSQVSRIGLQGSRPDQDVVAQVVLTVSRNGVRFPVELPAVRITKGRSAETRVIKIELGGVNVNLKKHLLDHRMYYSQAVFRSLDASQLALLLSGYSVQVQDQEVPVAQVIEPLPIRIVGNYLAFKMNSDAEHDRQWAQWLSERRIHIGLAKEDVIPMATGGTFAEAVLGRSNCAEKLDITRFWNWQDSPIPLQPSDIAAIQTGSRATNDDVKPGSLSNPIINITAPAGLPDPMGTAAVLSAIQNGNMFRDMSGLQATVGLAQAALQASAAGAASAGDQAGSNMNNLLKANTERQRIAAEMISSLAKTAASAYTGGAVGAGGGISPSNHSQDGAKINYFDKNQAPAAPGAGSSGGGAAPITAGGRSSGAGVASTPTSGANALMDSLGASAGSGNWSQNPGILAATWGDGVPLSSLVEKAMAYGFADNAEPMGGGKTGTNVQTREINLVGVFDWSNPAVSEDELIAELANCRWAPATEDFSAVSGGQVLLTPTFANMLGAIYIQAPGSISRLNLFTHANADLIGFGGHIEKRSLGRADVEIQINGPGDNLTAMDPSSMANLNQPGVFFEINTSGGKKQVTVEDLRKRFAPGAVLVLYACHSGQQASFIKSIATFFNVKVVGFSSVIGFYPPAQNVPHKFQRVGMKLGLGFGATPVSDWRALIADPSAIVATP